MKSHHSYLNIWLVLFFTLVISNNITAQSHFTSYNTSHFLSNDYLTENLAHEDSLNNDEPVNMGGWLQFGIGSTNAKLNYEFNPSQFTQLELSIHVRKSNSVYSFGAEQATTTCCWKITTFWGTYGYSLNSNYIDGSISAGLSYSEWQYDTESETGIIHSPGSPGVIIKAQLLPHFPIVLGLGLVFTVNASKEVSYTTISLVLAIGAWSE